MSKCITLFTDAGFCPNTNIGTWAAWAKFDNNQTMRFSGVLKGFVQNSDVAELRAMANGIHCAVSFWEAQLPSEQVFPWEEKVHLFNLEHVWQRDLEKRLEKGD